MQKGEYCSEYFPFPILKQNHDVPVICFNSDLPLYIYVEIDR